MKLEMSVPEHPGWIFVIPGFDFLALLLALVVLTGVVTQDRYVEMKLPPSEFRGVRLGDSNPVVVMLTKNSRGVRYLVGGKEVAPEDLRQVISDQLQDRGTRAVAMQIERDATVMERQALINALAKIENLRIFDGYRREPSESENP